jgi:peptide/nickel transport system substrate-binding protein
VAAARKLIEGAGWRLGADGIYAKDGVRLAAKVPVRDTAPDRIQMADLIALQARDCGMDLKSLPLSSGAIVNSIWTYPHHLPGTTTPFDLYLGGFTVAVDPAYVLMNWESSNIPDAKHPLPDLIDLGGFRDPVFDGLLAASLKTYDQAERASIYRQAQEELAAQVPSIFLWATITNDVVRAAVTSVDGPLDLSAPDWAWQPERLVVATSDP